MPEGDPQAPIQPPTDARPAVPQPIPGVRDRLEKVISTAIGQRNLAAVDHLEIGFRTPSDEEQPEEVQGVPIEPDNLRYVRELQAHFRARGYVIPDEAVIQAQEGEAHIIINTDLITRFVDSPVVMAAPDRTTTAAAEPEEADEDEPTVEAEPEEVVVAETLPEPQARTRGGSHGPRTSTGGASEPRTRKKRTAATATAEVVEPERVTLTPRERDILNLLAHGQSIQAIHQQLHASATHLTEGVIRQDINNINIKLGITTTNVESTPTRITIIKGIDGEFVDQQIIRNRLNETQRVALTTIRYIRVLNQFISDQPADITSINKMEDSHMLEHYLDGLADILNIPQNERNLPETRNYMAAVWKIYTKINPLVLEIPEETTSVVATTVDEPPEVTEDETTLATEVHLDQADMDLFDEEPVITDEFEHADDIDEEVTVTTEEEPIPSTSSRRATTQPARKRAATQASMSGGKRGGKQMSEQTLAIIAAFAEPGSTYEQVRRLFPHMTDREFTITAANLRKRGHEIPRGQQRRGSEISPKNQSIVDAFGQGLTYEQVRGMFPGMTAEEFSTTAAKLRSRGYEIPYAVPTSQMSEQTRSILDAFQIGASFAEVRARFPGLTNTQFSNIASGLRTSGYEIPYADPADRSPMGEQTKAVLAAFTAGGSFEEVRDQFPGMTQSRFSDLAGWLRRKGYPIPLAAAPPQSQMSPETRGVLDALKAGTSRADILTQFPGMSAEKLRNIIYRLRQNGELGNE